MPQLLETMLEDPSALVRQAAAFGLGELGGASSVRCLEQQLTREEARAGHDGAAVMVAITQALGRIEEAGARAGLVRRLKRLASREAALLDAHRPTEPVLARVFEEAAHALRQRGGGERSWPQCTEAPASNVCPSSPSAARHVFM
jgi:HEAT repeat protein